MNGVNLNSDTGCGVNMNKTTISIEEYRQMLNDQQSSNELISKRIAFMESLCRNVIRIELEKSRQGSKG